MAQNRCICIVLVALLLSARRRLPGTRQGNWHGNRASQPPFPSDREALNEARIRAPTVNQQTDVFFDLYSGLTYTHGRENPI